MRRAWSAANTERSPTGRARSTRTAQFSRLDAAQLYRYVPLAAGAGVREWIRTSLLAGGSSDARLKVSGNLADFPFADGKKGQFTLTAKAQGVTLDYATHWPRLTDLDGEVRVDGARISVDGRNARAFNAAIGRIKIEIPDMRIAHPALRIEGEAVGPAADFLRFIAESPVDEWLDHTTRGAEASGEGKLALKLELPIGNHDGDQIAGEFTFSGNRLKFGGGIPALNQLNGKLAFTRREIHSTALTAEILGGPARLTVSGAVGGMRVDAQGSADVGLLRSQYPQQVLAARLTGTTDWQLALNVASDRANWTLDTTLKGVTVDFPVPAAKSPGEAMPLRIERRQTEAASDLLQLTLRPGGAADRAAAPDRLRSRRRARIARTGQGRRRARSSRSVDSRRRRSTRSRRLARAARAGGRQRRHRPVAAVGSRSQRRRARRVRPAAQRIARRRESQRQQLATRPATGASSKAWRAGSPRRPRIRTAASSRACNG